VAAGSIVKHFDVIKDISSGEIECFVDTKDRKFYRVVEARFTENGRCILVTRPKERVSGGPEFVGAGFGT